MTADVHPYATVCTLSRALARLVLLALAVAYGLIGYAMVTAAGLFIVEAELLGVLGAGYLGGAVGCLLGAFNPRPTAVRLASTLLVVAPPIVHGVMLLGLDAYAAALRSALIVTLEIAFWPHLLRAAEGRRRRR